MNACVFVHHKSKVMIRDITFTYNSGKQVCAHMSKRESKIASGEVSYCSLKQATYTCHLGHLSLHIRPVVGVAL